MQILYTFFARLINLSVLVVSLSGLVANKILHQEDLSLLFTCIESFSKVKK